MDLIVPDKKKPATEAKPKKAAAKTKKSEELKVVPTQLGMETPAKESKKGKAKAKTEKSEKQVSAPTLNSLGLSPESSGVLKGARMVVPTQPKKAPGEPTSEQEVFVELDRRDEEAIKKQLVGGYVEDFVYEYCKTHKWPDGRRPVECQCTNTVLDLSWIGIQEASRQMKISVMPGTAWMFFNDDGVMTSSQMPQGLPDPGATFLQYPDRLKVMIRSQDTENGIVRIGIAEQKSKGKYTNGGMYDDEFYQQKALSKAQRNSLRQLIPQTVLKEWIEKFLVQKYGTKTKTMTIEEYERKMNELLELCTKNHIDASMEILKAKLPNGAWLNKAIESLTNGESLQFATYLGVSFTHQ